MPPGACETNDGEPAAVIFSFDGSDKLDEVTVNGDGWRRGARPRGPPRLRLKTPVDMRLAAASAGHFSPVTPLARFLTSGGLSVWPYKAHSVLKYTTISGFSSFTAAGANLSMIPPSAKG
jgi:hypothetical protein